MATRIRLQRHGRKARPFYHIVIADSRAKRDGRIVERIGSYNPNTNPATIDLNFDRALNWVQEGAQPSDTVRALLKYKGVMMMKHLLDGVKKGAFDQEEAEKRFESWIAEKEQTILGKKDRLSKEAADARAKALEAERAVNEARKASQVEATAEETSEGEGTTETTEEAAPEAPEADQAEA